MGPKGQGLVKVLDRLCVPGHALGGPRPSYQSVEMVRPPSEQVVEAILGVVGAIIEDEGGGKDVEDFYRVGVVVPNGITKELFDAGQKPEGTISEVSYMFPRPGETEPAQKISFVTKVGDIYCGVGYYK